MKQISRRSFVAASAATLGSLTGSRATTAQGLETLNIGLSPYINQATIFMANDMGLFSKMGLDIRMKIFMDGALVVAVRANQESWVSMVVDGKPYMDQVLVPGNEQMVRAREKIVLKTGNAGGLQISYNGKALAPIGKGGQVRTVTFTSTGIQQ